MHLANSAEEELPDVVYRSLYRERYKPHRKELVYPITVKLTTGQVITIPEGYITDLASVPALFWGIISPSGRHDLAVIIHDYLLDMGWPRKFADHEMRYWLYRSRVSALKSELMYRAVRGYSSFKSMMQLHKTQIIKPI